MAWLSQIILRETKKEWNFFIQVLLFCVDILIWNDFPKSAATSLGNSPNLCYLKQIKKKKQVRKC